MTQSPDLVPIKKKDGRHRLNKFQKFNKKIRNFSKINEKFRRYEDV